MPCAEQEHNTKTKLSQTKRLMPATILAFKHAQNTAIFWLIANRRPDSHD